MEKEIEVIEIDDKEYCILKEATYKEKTFLYLSNILDEEDTLIRKVSPEDKTIVIPLQDEKEFEIACNLLYKNIIN